MIPLRWVPIDRSKYPLPGRRVDRFPLERLIILAMLDDETLYGPSAATEVGYVKGTQEHLRTRRAFSFFSNENGIEDSYDNVERDSGEAKSWYGSSWKWAAGPRMHRAADLMNELAKRQRACPGVRFYLDNETILAEHELPAETVVKKACSPEPQAECGHAVAKHVQKQEQAQMQEPKPDILHNRSKCWRYLLIACLIVLCFYGQCRYLRKEALAVVDKPAEPAEPGRTLVMPPEFFGPGE